MVAATDVRPRRAGRPRTAAVARRFGVPWPGITIGRALARANVEVGPEGGAAIRSLLVLLLLLVACLAACGERDRTADPGGPAPAPAAPAAVAPAPAAVAPARPSLPANAGSRPADPACARAFTPTYQIQGSGMATPLDGRTVTTQGVVVGDFEGPAPALRGFYLQDPAGDDDPTTSDGLFVFHGDRDAVRVGDLVRVTGTAGEFQGQTQLSGVSSLVACGRGSVAPVDVTLPFPSSTYLERYEGMLVRLPQTLTVTDVARLGRFGEVTLAVDGRLPQPTQVAAPGADARALRAALELRRILLDDHRNDQDPDPIAFGLDGRPLRADAPLRAGDTVAGTVGVLTFGWAGHGASGNAYRLRPIGALGGGPPPFERANPRPDAPPPVGGSLRVGTLNLRNYFVAHEGCTRGVGGAPVDCRGAADADAFERQWPTTVAAILGLDVDVLAVIEVQNDGYGPESAIQDLTTRLNRATAPGTWAFVDADVATGQTNALGSDAIKVGLLYRPAAVAPVGRTAALRSRAFVTGGDRAARNRPALAQAFARVDDGAAFVAVAVHLKSKGSACDVPDAGDGQGACAVVRANAARELAGWLASDPTRTGVPDLLVLGDLNAYAREAPLAALASAGYVNLLPRLAGDDAYTYAFDGQWGALDHALASASLLGRVTGAATWPINADEPPVLGDPRRFPGAPNAAGPGAAYGSSDHDPIVVGLDLTSPAP